MKRLRDILEWMGKKNEDFQSLCKAANDIIARGTPPRAKSERNERKVSGFGCVL